MIEVEVTVDMIEQARHKAADLGKLKNSIRNGAGNLIGFIGEQMALEVLKGKWANTYDYDVVTEDGYKVDVKTKRTSVKPLPHYDCSIAKYNTKQDCDYYAFVRVRNDLMVGWFLGVVKKEDYFDRARFLKKDTIDEANNFRVKADCYNLAISELQEAI